MTTSGNLIPNLVLSWKNERSEPNISQQHRKPCSDCAKSETLNRRARSLPCLSEGETAEKWKEAGGQSDAQRMWE